MNTGWPAPSNAIAVLERAIQLNPRCVEAMALLGTAFGLQGQMFEGLKLASRAVGIRPSSFEARFHRGMAYDNLRQYKSSAADFRAAMQLRPEDDHATFDAINADLMRCWWRERKADRRQLQSALESMINSGTFGLSNFPSTTIFATHSHGLGPEASLKCAQKLALEAQYVADQLDPRLIAGFSLWLTFKNPSKSRARLVMDACI